MKEMGWKSFLVAFLIGGLFLLFILNPFLKNLQDFFYAQISQPLEGIFLVKIPEKPKRSNLEITAESAISIQVGKGGQEKILLKKNADKALLIASLTKLMTAVIVLEDEANYGLSQSITVSKEAVAQPEDFGDLKIEEGLSVENLLHIMLIESSNDAAYALAEKIGVENFVERMNQRAEILGLAKTYFINPTGLDLENSEEPNNYSSATDLAKLAQYILDYHPIIFEISSKSLYEVLDNSGSPHHLVINKNELLTSFSENIVGGKTGFTYKAGGCILLVLKDKKGNFFINVILGTESREASFEEMKKIIDWLET